MHGILPGTTNWPSFCYHLPAAIAFCFVFCLVLPIGQGSYCHVYDIAELASERHSYKLLPSGEKIHGIVPSVASRTLS